MPSTACRCILFGQPYHAPSIRDAARQLVGELHRRYPTRLAEEAKRSTWLGSRGERHDHRVARNLYANVNRFSRNDLVERSESLLEAMGLPAASFRITFFD